MDAKDYFYNIGKSLDIPTIMESKIYRAELFEIFYSFIDAEYQTLFLSKRGENREAILADDESGLLDKMTYANMVDSDEYKQYRRQAYSKLYCFLELLQRAESLKKIP